MIGIRLKVFDKIRLPNNLSKPANIDIKITHAGAFEFYVEHAAPLKRVPYPTPALPIAHDGQRGDDEAKRVQGKHGYFNVDPIIRITPRARILDPKSLDILPVGKGGSVLKAKQEALSQDALVLQTFVAKWAGSLSEWAPHLDEATASGYNMLHFPPLQVRGRSNSPYSIADQTDFAVDLFDEKAGKHATKQQRFETMTVWLDRLRSHWGLLSMVDIVLNHTSFDSHWLKEHPEAAYNPDNSPHLTPADELDRALFEYSNRLSSLGLPTDPKSEADVAKIIDGVKQHVLQSLKLWEFYVIDATGHKQDFKNAWDSFNNNDGSSRMIHSLGEDESLQGRSASEAAPLLKRHALRNHMALADRFTTHLDIPLSVCIMRNLVGEGTSSDEAADAFGKAIDELNVPLYATYDDDVKAILSNLSGRLTYMRVDAGGPKVGPITKESPFCEPYFTRLDAEDPEVAKHRHSAKKLSLANNGWIWAADPLMDFASSKSRVYLRREVIVWADCVKLRYGRKPADSPFLWKHMEEYCSSLAKMFNGVRIDNCHSTPIHVGEHFLDVARKANKDLYVCAELFTGSAEMDVHFVKRLGINSLIREMENGHDAKEESRLLYRFGVNKPIGSMDAACLSKVEGNTTIVPLQGSSPHALFMDLTHDNETPSKKRTAQDAITMGALVNFSWSAIGSTKGFDNLYPDLLNIVSEKRRYAIPTVGENDGITPIKRLFNHLHVEMVHDGYSEGHVHQEGSYIMMHRIHPQTHKGYLVLANTAFTGNESGSINPVKLNRTKVRYVMGARLDITSNEAPKDENHVRGLPSKLVSLPAPEIKEDGKESDGSPFAQINVGALAPASVMLFATDMEGLGPDLDALCQEGADKAFSELDLVDLNVVLYRADAEERDSTDGQDGVYSISDLGAMVYCGTEGWMPHLDAVMRNNDLGHPLCAHLRNGTWALDYIHSRLEKQTAQFPRLAKPAAWFKERFDRIKETVPSFMRPKYFALVVKTASDAAKRRAFGQMSDFVKDGDDFTKSLALTAIQMNGQVKSASLWPDRSSASMAAGLPFFATSWARLWGRDVFISLRGLYLTTAMHAAAREHILSFGSTLWNGLIPNLLNSTRAPRYNCRDGPWFYSQNVQDYVTKVPQGETILSEKVKRRFLPYDSEWYDVESPQAFSKESTVAELIQEILQQHATGIHFREHDAGPKVDNDMTDKGFNIDIDVDWETGIIFGGNPSNCGTWQDKMGSSAKAGNKGVPGSSREGAAVEITGLLKSTLRWVDSLASKGAWPAKGVEIKGGKTLTYKQWGGLLQSSFEKSYWVPLDAKDDANYKVDPKLVNRRGIYKDVFGSSKGREWCDYQLRANFPMAMCVAPELFDKQHAQTALQAADAILRDVLGMKTLDPSDSNFHPVYDNSDDSSDYWMAKGMCYHNGPPWVFPFGFFLRAHLLFFNEEDTKGDGTLAAGWRAMSMLKDHRAHIRTSPWAGLPELTNADGRECRDACPTQAWSASTILDALELLYHQQQASSSK